MNADIRLDPEVSAADAERVREAVESLVSVWHTCVRSCREAESADMFLGDAGQLLKAAISQPYEDLIGRGSGRSPDGGEQGAELDRIVVRMAEIAARLDGGASVADADKDGSLGLSAASAA